MTSATGTIGPYRIIKALIYLPAAGEWWGDIEIDDAPDPELTGQQVVTIGDLELTGTVQRGGSWQGAGSYRIVAGAGSWGTEVPRQGYAGGSVLLSTVVGDLERLTGETVTGYTERTLGEVWARETAPARRILDSLAGPAGWHVSTAGVTTIGSRPSSTVDADYTLVRYRPEQRLAIVATELPAAFLPGAVLTINGIARSVSSTWIELEPERLRVHLLVDDEADGRLRRALRRIARDAIPELRFHGLYEYRVTGSDGNTWHLQATDPGSGVPDLMEVPLKPGMPGANAELPDGSRVLVQFVNASPGRPVVTHFEDPDAGGWQPTSVELTGASITLGDGASSTALGSAPRLGVARTTDAVTVGGFGGTITGGSLTVTAGL